MQPIISSAEPNDYLDSRGRVHVFASKTVKQHEFLESSNEPMICGKRQRHIGRASTRQSRPDATDANGSGPLVLYREVVSGNRNERSVSPVCATVRHRSGMDTARVTFRRNITGFCDKINVWTRPGVTFRRNITGFSDKINIKSLTGSLPLHRSHRFSNKYFVLTKCKLVCNSAKQGVFRSYVMWLSKNSVSMFLLKCGMINRETMVVVPF